METGEDTIIMEHKKAPRLTFDAYIKNYSSLIKYFINLRLSKCRSNYIKNNKEDVYQEVCLHIWKLMNEKPELSITSEVLRQNVNWKINRMERKEYKSPIRNIPDLNSLTSLTTEQDLDEEHTAEFYEDCMEYVETRFSDLNQQIFYLRYHLDLPYKEIDDRLNITSGNARKKYNRMIQELKQYAEKEV